MLTVERLLGYETSVMTNWKYNFGFMTTSLLACQVCSGIAAIHVYNGDLTQSFYYASVYSKKEVNIGWHTRYIHATCVSVLQINLLAHFMIK